MLPIQPDGRSLLGFMTSKQLDHIQELGSTIFLILSSFLVGEIDGWIEKTSLGIFTIFINYILGVTLDKFMKDTIVPVYANQPAKPDEPKTEETIEAKKETQAAKKLWNESQTPKCRSQRISIQ